MSAIRDSVQGLSDWLETTHASMVIQEVNWIIPTVQTIHILAISVVMAAIVMVDLRLIGVAMRGQPAAIVARRFLPWVWYALVVLLLSGAILITGEPGRSLLNPAFILKMSLLAAVIVITALLQRSLRNTSPFWELAPGTRVASSAIAVISLMLWIGILFAGRWIAYTGG